MSERSDSMEAARQAAAAQANRTARRLSWAGAAVLLGAVAAGLVVLVASSPADSSGRGQPAVSDQLDPFADPARHGQSNPAPAHPLPPADNMRIQVRVEDESPDALLDPAAAAWRRATATAVLLHRAPRIYQTEPPTWRVVAPTMSVRTIRADGSLWVRLKWQDATADASPLPQPLRVSDTIDSPGGGDPQRLYKAPTTQPAAFADAAAVMVPDAWSGGAFPSLMMGDAEQTATIYAWHAVHGAVAMSAAGRATPQPLPMPAAHVPFAAARDEDGWVVVLRLPDQPNGYPLAFAVWDGRLGDRDGLKWFSLWYVLSE